MLHDYSVSSRCYTTSTSLIIHEISVNWLCLQHVDLLQIFSMFTPYVCFNVEDIYILSTSYKTMFLSFEYIAFFQILTVKLAMDVPTDLKRRATIPPSPPKKDEEDCNNK